MPIAGNSRQTVCYTPYSDRTASPSRSLPESYFHRSTGKSHALYKDIAGSIHAMPNACPHMGAMLSEGWCETEGDRVLETTTHQGTASAGK